MFLTLSIWVAEVFGFLPCRVGQNIMIREYPRSVLLSNSPLYKNYHYSYKPISRDITFYLGLILFFLNLINSFISSKSEGGILCNRVII